MKKKQSSILGLSLASLLVLGALTGCNGNKGSSEDSDINNIYIGNFNSGYGDAWLKGIGERFEAAVANKLYTSTGKKGVKITWDSEKDQTFYATSQNILQGRNEILFTENRNDIWTRVESSTNPYLDITDMLTSANSFDNDKTIESKLYDAQKDFLKNKASGKYYALPHLSGTYGFTANLDIFDAVGAYFDQDGDIIGTKMTPALEATKSYGPDGKAGTLDDGFPVTYDQFYTLCNHLYNSKYEGNDIVPLSMPGMYYLQHIGCLVSNVASAVDGVAGTISHYAGQGTNVDVVKFDESNQIVYSEGKPVIEKCTFDTSSIANGNRLAGQYYATDFIKGIVNGNDGRYFLNDQAYGSSVTHVANQKNFLKSGIVGLEPQKADNTKYNYAMLIDGTWWETESDKEGNFSAISSVKPEVTKYTRRFRWMPMPVPSEDYAAQEKPAVYDCLNSYMFVKGNLDASKYEIIKDFVQFAYSDKELVEFTKVVGQKKNLKYDVADSDLTGLSSFARDYIKYSSTVEFVSAAAQTSYFTSNADSFSNAYSIFKTTIDNVNFVTPGEAFHKDASITSAKYFTSFFTQLLKK